MQQLHLNTKGAVISRGKLKQHWRYVEWEEMGEGEELIDFSYIKLAYSSYRGQSQMKVRLSLTSSLDPSPCMHSWL